LEGRETNPNKAREKGKRNRVMTKDITCINDTGSKYEQDAAGNK
jgi:hypothetical protein